MPVQFFLSTQTLILQLACRSNHPDTCETLMKHCSAKPQDRFCGNGKVPLHEAAAAGHVKCIKVLLAQGAAPHPRYVVWRIAGMCFLMHRFIGRCVNGETPVDLAKKKHHKDCVSHLENYKPPTPKFSQQQYMQRNIDRNVSRCPVYQYLIVLKRRDYRYSPSRSIGITDEFWSTCANDQ